MKKIIVQWPNLLILLILSLSQSAFSKGSPLSFEMSGSLSFNSSEDFPDPSVVQTYLEGLATANAYQGCLIALGRVDSFKRIDDFVTNLSIGSINVSAGFSCERNLINQNDIRQMVNNLIRALDQDDFRNGMDWSKIESAAQNLLVKLPGFAINQLLDAYHPQTLTLQTVKRKRAILEILGEIFKADPHAVMAVMAVIVEGINDSVQEIRDTAVRQIIKNGNGALDYIDIYHRTGRLTDEGMATVQYYLAYRTPLDRQLPILLKLLASTEENTLWRVYAALSLFKTGFGEQQAQIVDVLKSTITAQAEPSLVAFSITSLGNLTNVDFLPWIVKGLDSGFPMNLQPEIQSALALQKLAHFPETDIVLPRLKILAETHSDANLRFLFKQTFDLISAP